ncbi:MAG TPA: alkaline phosphatase family protein [Candidatus Limnocylindrales bacterium]|nr:alkaline phosphatase family protein [Candidatus Limnocylindrales bacterium]
MPVAPTTPPATTAPAGSPSPSEGGSAHVVLVVFENKSYDQIVGRAAAPTFNRLISEGALSTAYRAVAHPSLPNYLALVGGSTFGIASDCPPSACPVSATNLGSLLSAHGRTWKAYMESMPSTCGTSTTDGYAVKHDPFVYFDDVRTTDLCRNVVPFGELAADLAARTLPRFSFVTPNICNDMHDCAVGVGDAWLASFTNALFASSAWTASRSLLIVTFDEDDGAASNRVLTFAVGSPIGRRVVAGTTSGVGHDHYDLLRTIESVLGVPTLGRNDATAHVMTDLVPG